MQVLSMERDRWRNVPPESGFVEVDEPAASIVEDAPPPDYRAALGDSLGQPETPQRRHPVAGHVDAGPDDLPVRGPLDDLALEPGCGPARAMASPAIPPPTIRMRIARDATRRSSRIGRHGAKRHTPGAQPRADWPPGTVRPPLPDRARIGFAVRRAQMRTGT